MSSRRGLRVVVIGGTGNVGTSVVSALGATPDVETVLAVARRPTAWTTSKTTFVTTDIATGDLRAVVRGADAVIHLAWLFQPTRKPAVTWRNNVLGAIGVFDAVAAERVPALVYASSVAAYSPRPSDREVSENWPTHGWPGAAYPREKAYLERWLDAYEIRNPAVRVVRMRPGFIFKRESATSQRRLFGGPFVPGSLARRAAVPAVPLPDQLRVQILHTDDAAAAYVQAVLRPVHGAYNLATDPPVDRRFLADYFGARPVRIPAGALRATLAAAWHTRLVPATPGLVDTVLHLPLMDSTRARTELDWSPAYTPHDTFTEFLDGLRAGSGLPTAPLAADTARRRWHEITTGVGRTP
ncbi:NAD-dependent epimerase/dehydratase family protein [Rhodococcus sp. NCIMB 12038]|uniref:NAD-dependent epimerase/dehydratase family protein n=1 Tax=Rhodococcus sp. NCIMB 12038 TaxID=933800 RepID=UPI000B3CBCFA|nr:NAD-dependent epimerase/dehydratase family protein [Rhodococcus sp. NCIMB 12038]OUS96354.1 NAD-dependent epimerase [Rhodococcus sp. NCIMB 12038]